MPPFVRLPFDTLPATPRVPHAWATLPRQWLTITTTAFGPTKICYRTAGSGPPLLLVHGLMTTGYSWRYAWPALAEHFTLYIPDLPGSGDSDTPDAPLDPRDVADHLAATIDALHIRGCAVIGNSMGGYLCMWLALRHPQAMSRLLQLHGPGLPTPRLWALYAAMRLPGAHRLLGALVRHDPLRWAHRNVHYWDESLKSIEEAETYGLPLITPHGAAGFVSQLRDTMSAPVLATFKRTVRDRGTLGLPLLLVYARRDPMVPPTIGPALARLLPGTQLVWLDEASHFAHVDAVEDFLPVALTFLRTDEHA